ncbi:MAG: sulfotransferase [Cryomorphaceae bacterium]|nr:sulfotransferase [Flavobacteriales bacterium]
MVKVSKTFPLNFLIAGTMKSGTSSLSYILDKHPDISLPDRELHYFDRNFEKGQNWYRSELLKKGEQFRFFGEKTPDYALEDSFADEIQNLNPNVKLVWIFRNPAKRAFSHYLHNVRSGRENKPFWEALDLGTSRKDKIYDYRGGSNYPEMIRRYAKRFPVENMYYLTFEDFVASPEQEVQKVLAFLGAKPVQDFEYASHRHKTLMPRYPGLLYFTRQYIGYESRIWNRVYRFANAPSRVTEPPKIPTETYTQLQHEFENQVEDLKKLTSLDLSVWT